MDLAHAGKDTTKTPEHDATPKKKPRSKKKQRRVLNIAPDGKNIKLEKFVKVHRSLKRHAPQEDAKPHKSLAKMLIQKAKNALKRKQSEANLEDEPDKKKPSAETPTNNELQTAIQSCLGPSWRIREIEAGGGGDCFFLSVAAALQRMMASGDPYKAHVLRKCQEQLQKVKGQHLLRTCERWLH